MSELMRAAVLDVDGLRIERIPVPEPRDNEVLLRVSGCGVCHSDLHVVRGGIAFPKPCVLGHETSGVVVAHGRTMPPGTPPIGAKVVSSFVMPCGDCAECLRARDDLCLNFFGMNRTHGTLYDGTSRLGRADGERLNMFSMSGMAEYAVVPALAVFELPDSLPATESALLGCAALTAYGAITHGADGVEGKTVAVVASGGIGLNLIQLSRIMGAHDVIAIDISDEKIKTALEAGASSGVNSADTDAVSAVRDLTGGLGVDVAFEALGNPVTFRQAFDMVRNGGRTVPVGLSPLDVQVPINKVVRSQVAIHGSYGARSRRDMPALLRLLDDAAFDPRGIVSSTVPIEQLPSVLDDLEAGAIKGRAVIDLHL